ncbi:MAG TPA: hypothetical protein PLS70_08085, partial [Acidobacteriota bacterium]|nr:hypothetical protein [Acidobacteriota bacterium]
MSLDTSILNVGEYFSSHYLESTFSKDVAALADRWKEDGSQAVSRKLQNLAQTYFRAKAQALDESHPERRTDAGDDVRAWHTLLRTALGYGNVQPFDFPVEGGERFVPAVGRVDRYNKPWLVLCETWFTLPESALRDGQPTEDPLELTPAPTQLCDRVAHLLCGGDWARCIGRLFTEEDAPRWVLFLAGSQILLLDRHTFAQGRYLAFDLDDAFGRRERDTFTHIAAFLALETLCPDGEANEVLLDKLNEQSHRFAHGVTENLQHALREAIELLVNEWAYDRTERQKLPLLRLRPHEIVSGMNVVRDDDGNAEITAEQLKREALAFVYRLLFCLYAEARGGELEILPIDDDTYRLGYSFDSLRDLEQIPLTPTTEDGTYFHEHLKVLFRIIHQGFHPERETYNTPLAPLLQGEGTLKTFEIRPLTATLFAPESTPLLGRARLSNRCLQQVIRRLSLSKDDRSRTIGRVNYAELGINQLGAVYEGLLSYKGQFADQDLIHVKPASGSFQDKKTTTWFVSKDRLPEFETDEVERLEGGKPRIYTKGTFILHLSGIDREQSASYYTPEVLTRCLVEESLRELLADFGPDDADRILDLKICEPAMGSGAFLNEAADQLAHRYLDLKQKQTGRTVEPAQYADEVRRVKHFITTRNVYGVDLNATAVELGALSLWLGSVHRLLQYSDETGGRDRYLPGATPWFGLRLRSGNSLIGARRAVWKIDHLKRGKHIGKDGELPRLLAPNEARRPDEVYHFLVFDEEMIPTHGDKLVRGFQPEACTKAKDWLTRQVKPKWSDSDLKDALTICDLIDRQWNRFTEQRQEALNETACTATVWPLPAKDPKAIAAGPSLERQERVKANLESSSGSFQRLKLVMDVWCALWFWPLEQVQNLPTRESFLAVARLLLGDEFPKADTWGLIEIRLGFSLSVLQAASASTVPDTGTLALAIPWLGITQRLAAEQSFHHWELTFPEILGPTAPHAGFDLIVGNPPWIQVAWVEATVLSEIEPLLGVQEAKSAEYNRKRSDLITNEKNKAYFFEELRKIIGASSFLNSLRLYNELRGMKVNLYKNFIVRSWDLISTNG